QPNITLEGVTGDIQINGYEGDETILEADRMGVINASANSLVVEGSAGDVSLRVPLHAHITIEGVAGDVTIQNIQGKVHIEGLAGDVEMINVAHATIEGMATGSFPAQGIADAVRKNLQRSFSFSFGRRARAAEPQTATTTGTSRSAPLDEERLTILRMLQEKKINAEEAEQLLQALGEE
ncbi:MAG: SHOCT-like domain-containing protein, partial [Anaerolineales bacterium]